MTGAEKSVSITIRITTRKYGSVGLGQIVQQGFMIRAELGHDIRTILCDQLGMDHHYFDTRINTIFIDGKAVDDVHTALVNNGSWVALSGSLPGFVGAALRKDSFYSSMRKEISYPSTVSESQERTGLFFVRLYNMMIGELGPFFLRYGIILDAKVAAEFFRFCPTSFRENCLRIKINDQTVDPKIFFEDFTFDSGGLVSLAVTTDDTSESPVPLQAVN